MGGHRQTCVGSLPGGVGKGEKVGTVANGRQDIRAELGWDVVGSHQRSGGAVVDKPAV